MLRALDMYTKTILNIFELVIYKWRFMYPGTILISADREVEGLLQNYVNEMSNYKHPNLKTLYISNLIGCCEKSFETLYIIPLESEHPGVTLQDHCKNI